MELFLTVSIFRYSAIITLSLTTLTVKDALVRSGAKEKYF